MISLIKFFIIAPLKWIKRFIYWLTKKVFGKLNPRIQKRNEVKGKKVREKEPLAILGTVIIVSCILGLIVLGLRGCINSVKAPSPEKRGFQSSAHRSEGQKKSSEVDPIALKDSSEAPQEQSRLISSPMIHWILIDTLRANTTWSKPHRTPSDLFRISPESGERVEILFSNGRYIEVGSGEEIDLGNVSGKFQVRGPGVKVFVYKGIKK